MASCFDEENGLRITEKLREFHFIDFKPRVRKLVAFKKWMENKTPENTVALKDFLLQKLSKSLFQTVKSVSNCCKGI